MADFPTALNEALEEWYDVAGADFKTPITETRGLHARMHAMEKAYGSKKAAAAAAGIGYSTWRAWGGKKPRQPSPASLTSLSSAHNALLRARRVRGRAAPLKMYITAEVACTTASGKKGSNRYNRVKHRIFRADRSNLNLVPTINKWGAGASPKDVAADALDAIKSAYGARFEFEGDDVTVEFPK